jgi:hypothetical protein
MSGQLDLFDQRDLPPARKPPKEQEIRYCLIVGLIWDPSFGPCAMELPIFPHDSEQILAAAKTRDFRTAIWEWARPQTADFREVLDFAARIGLIETDWQRPDSEEIFDACMTEEEVP